MGDFFVSVWTLHKISISLCYIDITKLNSNKWGDEIMQKRILVVDDEVKLTEVILSYLEKSDYQVFTAHSCEEARMSIAENQPDLMILDLMLPDQSGESFCVEVREKSLMPIIMLTAKTDEADFLKGLAIGADDYMTKPFSVRQLVAKVGALLRRLEMDVDSVNAHPSHSPLGESRPQGLIIKEESWEVIKGNKIISTTPNEFRILSCLMRHPQKVFTREELILMALGDDFEGFDRTVDSYIKNLRQKIEEDTKNPKIILTVHGIGYKYGGDPS